MKRFLVIIILIVISMVVLLKLSTHDSESTNRKLNVVATTGQVTDIVHSIAGNRVNIVGLMGAGVDPHLYKASESDVQRLAAADVILFNGLKLEAKMQPIFEKMSRSKIVVPVAEAISKEHLLDSESYQGHFDPHVWFDVLNWKTVVEKVGFVLIQADPDNAAEYQRRMMDYLSQLDELHQMVVKKSQELKPEQRVLVTAHDAFRYFGKAYGFDVVGLQGISTDSQAGTADVIRLAEFITKRKIRAIFVESSVPERNIQAVVEAVRARGWDVKVGGELFSDAMGDAGTLEGTYMGMIKHNIETIVNGLKG